MKYLRITFRDPSGVDLVRTLHRLPDSYSPVSSIDCSTIQVEYLADIPPAMPRESYPDHPDSYPWYPLNFTQEGDRIVHEGSRFYLPPNGLFYEVDKYTDKRPE